MVDYFEIITDDERFPDRWFLNDPFGAKGQELDAREFRYGRIYNGDLPVRVPIGHQGRPVAFHLGAFDMPVISKQVGDILENIAPNDIQRFPVIIDDDIGGYEILNVVAQEKCVDETRSNVRKWGPENGRPDKLGHYIDFDPLVIDPALTNGKQIFRLWGYSVALVCSDVVKKSIERIPELGVMFLPVTGNDIEMLQKAQTEY